MAFYCKKSLVFLGLVMVMGVSGPNSASAQNAFKDFFNAIGSATKEVFSDDKKNTPRKKQNFSSQSSQQDQQIAPPRKKVVADPKLRNTQAALNKVGFNAGKPDGIYGKRTGQAIGQFQTSIGNPATGRLSAGERDILLARARDAKVVASNGSSASQQQTQGLSSADPDLKDALPEASKDNYFDADEPEDETLPPTPTSSN